MSVWHTESAFAKRFRQDFVHPILAFKDRCLFHRDRERVTFFVLQFIVDVFLRRLLMSTDATVSLPFAADKETLEFYRGTVAQYLEMMAGIRGAAVTLRCDPNPEMS
jgi:hypothetical protein